MNLKEISRAKLPTIWGEFIIIGFEEISTGKNHIALIYGINKIDKTNIVLTRIHSECLTGDTLFSLRCDCGFQLKSSLIQISKENCGILIYHRQEGRNIGLLNKIKAYNYQDNGLDTVEANHKLGFAADERNYNSCANILKILGILKIKLLTNNPNKINILKKNGINVVSRIPLIVGYNSKNNQYLKTKSSKMGHILE
ncbi:GTP cyclohydrolase II [Enterobacteriaceae endosymbiont of Plateumaris consimilis]|uniref:GTP cyclohydrolase II n=1 Tax=Enterobacteriaceae endosymbiont of Plateumaris consimilis TaxID=2675794 RepID=UPI001448CAFE|nr:GTP cyclohydrolase II [Enterobacteriaceae endosymbiont of Plateumaris consimilis]QJC28761.1 GTP cyclohydrolase II [Enterobacteriaceae endosymbiont of Plateumaris consimilis]